VGSAAAAASRVASNTLSYILKNKTTNYGRLEQKRINMYVVLKEMSPEIYSRTDLVSFES
jgi:hypothetical protein